MLNRGVHSEYWCLGVLLIVVVTLRLGATHNEASLLEASIDVGRYGVSVTSKAATSTRVPFDLPIPSLISLDVKDALSDSAAEHFRRSPRVAEIIIHLACVTSDARFDLDMYQVILHTVELHEHGLHLEVVVLTHAHHVSFELVNFPILLLLTLNENYRVVERLLHEVRDIVLPQDLNFTA